MSADVSEKKRIGCCAGFTFWYDGGMIPGGRSRSGLVIIAWTSCAAASMSRSSENCIVTAVAPRFDVDVMLSMPAIDENCFSSGVATADAIVSGLAPGSDAFTVMVGKSTAGRSLTGSRRYAETPKNRIIAMTSTVVTGRRMNNPEILIPLLLLALHRVLLRVSLHIHRGARNESRLSVDDDVFARFQASVDRRHLTHCAADLDRPHLRDFVAADDVHVVPLLSGKHGARRNGD